MERDTAGPREAASHSMAHAAPSLVYPPPLSTGHSTAVRWPGEQFVEINLRQEAGWGKVEGDVEDKRERQ